MSQKKQLEKEPVTLTYCQGCGGGFAYLQLSTHQNLMRLGKRAENIQTWGDLREAISEDEFNKLPDWDINRGEYAYRDGCKLILFDPERTTSKELEESGCIIEPTDKIDMGDFERLASYGVLPAWAGYFESECELLPKDFIEQYGFGVNTMEGSWWEFPWDKKDEINAKLEMRGYKVVVSPEEGAH